MEFSVAAGIEILERTPNTLRAWLAGLSEEWIEGNEGPDTFSPRENLGHLIHGEREDWIVRARVILEHGESTPFEPWDRFAHRTLYATQPLGELLDLFARLRGENLATLRIWHVTADQLSLLGQHPALGRVTLRQLLATWVAHDLGHIGQIARVMAKQYRDEVGPWYEFLPVLHPRVST